MSVTALQLVNRVRARHRFGTTASIASDDFGAPILDAINEAKEEVLEGYEWDFNVRHEGLIQTVTKLTSTGVTIVANGDATVFISGFDGSTFFDNSCVARCIITSDSAYGDTAFRILYGQYVGGNTTFELEQDFPGTSSIVADITILTYELRLDDTVLDVLSVRHQERDVGLEFIPRNKSWDGVFTRPTSSLSDTPDVAYIGSTITPTYTTGGTANPGRGIAVYPVPETSYRLDYSYVYSHPVLTSDSDTLANVPRKVVDRIVNVAVAKLYLSHVSNDPRMGTEIMDREMSAISRIQSRDRPDRARRRSLQSHFGSRGKETYPSAGPKNRHVFYEP